VLILLSAGNLSNYVSGFLLADPESEARELISLSCLMSAALWLRGDWLYL
jgi:hypothetical protein